MTNVPIEECLKICGNCKHFVPSRPETLHMGHCNNPSHGKAGAMWNEHCEPDWQEATDPQVVGRIAQSAVFDCQVWLGIAHILCSRGGVSALDRAVPPGLVSLIEAKIKEEQLGPQDPPAADKP